MRKPRRLLGAAVVLGVAGAACYESDRLSQTSQRAVVLMPGSNYNFGTVPLGMSAATQPDPYFTIRAQSETDDDYVQSIVLVQPGCGSDFSLDLTQPLPAEVYCMGASTGSGLAPGSGSATTLCTSYVDYQFGARFSPSQLGSQSCRVDITTMPRNSTISVVQSVFLNGGSLAATYAMGVSPTTIDFGDVALGSSSSPQTVTVKNTGASTIHFQGSNFDPTHYSVTPAVQGPYALAQNGTKPFQVTCNAGSAEGTYNGSLWFFTLATEGSLAQEVMLKCRAVATSIHVIPNPVNLGTHLLGDGGSTVGVTITNTSSTTSVNLANFRLTGTPGTEISYPGDPGAFSLGPGLQALINLQYAPTSERDTGPLGSMTFDVNGSATNIPLIGGAHMGSIGTNPASLDFGTVCAGSAASIDLTVFANAGGDIHLDGQLTGPSTPFTATLAGSATLMAHHGNEVTITTTASPPADEMPGDKTDQVSLITNIPGMGTVPIDMHANVLAGGVAPAPTLVHFGPNALDKPSPAQTVTLTNCGDGDLTITDASFSGSDGAEFAIVSPADPHVTITKTQSQQFLVVMTPQTAGVKSSQLVFSYAGGTASVALDGTGFGGTDGGGNKDRETYYACAVGAPSGLIPLALAAFAVRRRRRR